MDQFLRKVESVSQYVNNVDNSLKYYTPAFKAKARALLDEINPVAALELITELHKDFLVARSICLAEAFSDKTDFEAINEATKKINSFQVDTVAAVVANVKRQQERLDITMKALGE